MPDPIRNIKGTKDINRKPDDIKKYINADQYKLYDLIWSRALSSQMNPAEFDRNTILISSKDNNIHFRASGSIIKFEGFLKIYKVQETDEDAKNILPEVKVGDEVNILNLNDEQHFTEPPPRYSEASLVKKNEITTDTTINRPRYDITLSQPVSRFSCLVIATASDVSF